ncbi:HlyD family efflux transporter periplasmic adaptor subunit [Actinomadura sp. 6N118]|uniref:HlyD family efflux transporter periplasmic adaptor subunit n=1 Tax=Actinomadura sp. 6N118 TaxID=3375151 RepID=UPI0037B3383F
MKRKTIIGAAAALVVAATGAGITVNATADGGGGDERRGAGAAMTTAPVERGDLSDSSSVQGTLGYGGERKLKAGAGGTVTWVKSPGSTVRLNGRLYELDGRPVRLMYGTRPMYRTLKTGDEGPDVLQLEKNLSALGYSLTVDQKYTAATADAVRRWRKAHDDKAKGTVGPDAIVFAPGPVRVKSRDASAGDRVAPGSPVVTSSGAEQVVNLKLEVDQASTLRKGTKVTVELPGGRTARGAVRSIGTTAAKDGGGGEGGGDEGEAKVDVVIKLDDPRRAGGLDQAPVTVNITTQTSKDVLSVPVQALLALPGGGYGIRVVAPGTPRTVKVELGVFGEGRVEVTGQGLNEGMKVEVPKS